ncbi:hypothetical protein JTB14_014645 [Gonioctena quinquepunctata]|nr:hypothetical protein JTB14_014645 [Gonioctena quinquepunctata]
MWTIWFLFYNFPFALCRRGVFQTSLDYTGVPVPMGVHRRTEKARLISNPSLGSSVIATPSLTSIVTNPVMNRMVSTTVTKPLLAPQRKTTIVQQEIGSSFDPIGGVAYSKTAVSEGGLVPVGSVSQTKTLVDGGAFGGVSHTRTGLIGGCEEVAEEEIYPQIG